MPTKTWVVGEEVLAADFNSYVQRQVVATFANAAARDAAIPSPTEGQMAYLMDTDLLYSYRNARWRPPIGTVLATGAQTLPDLNLVAGGVYDVQSIDQALTYPFDSLTIVNLAMWAGFGGGTVNMAADIFGFGPGGAVTASPGITQSVPAGWVTLPLTGVWGLAPGVSTGFKVRINFGAGPNCHTGGQVSWQHIVHL